MLIKPAFEEPMNTEHDILQTPVDIMVPGNTSIVTLISIDPRPSIQMLGKQAKFYSISPGGNVPQFIREG